MENQQSRAIAAIPAIRDTFTLRLQPSGRIVQTRLTRTEAEGYARTYNEDLKARGRYVEMLPECPTVVLLDTEPIVV